MLASEFQIGEWLIHPVLNYIKGAEGATSVTPKAMQVLWCLARQPGAIVSRETLFETVWAETMVVDDALTQTISELRKAFHDHPQRPTIIETVPGKGYRLIAPVTLRAQGDSAPTFAPVITLAPSAKGPERAGGTRWRSWAALGAVAVVVGGMLWYQVGRSSVKGGLSFGVVRPLTTYVGQEIQPALSPDGKHVAFTWSGPDSLPNWDVYIKIIGTETPYRLTQHPGADLGPAWSPDGLYVAFMRRTPSGCGVYVIPSLGGAERRLASCNASQYADLAWSPDGRWLAFADRATPDSAFSITLLAADGTERRSLTHPPATLWGDYHPSFSPDGSLLAFSRSYSEGVQELFVLPVEGGEEVQRTFDGRNLSGHTWLADGHTLVMSSDRGGLFNLWALSADGDTPQVLAPSSLLQVDPTASPAEGMLVYQQVAFDIDIWHLHLAGGDEAQPTPAVASTQWELHPSFSPDGRRVAFTSIRSGSFEIWVSDHAGNQPLQLTSFGGPFLSTPRWAPDGERLSFEARLEGQADLFMIEAEGGNPVPLTTSPFEDLAPSWSPDGQYIYFGSNRGGTWEVWKYDLAGGAARQVTSGGGYAAQVSPDGAWLYYTRYAEPGLWRQPTTGGAPRRVLEDLHPDDWGNWALVDGGIYYVQRSGRHTPVVFYDLATRQKETILVPPAPIPGKDPALALSGDAQWLLFGQLMRAENDLMILEPSP